MAREKREFTPYATRRRIPLTENERKLRLASGIDAKEVTDRPFNTRYTMNHDAHIETGARYGPFVWVSRQLWDPSVVTERKFFKSQTSWRSKTKRRKPNPFRYYQARCDLRGLENKPDAPNSWYGHNASNGLTAYDALAQNKARTQFVGKVRDQNAASLAVTLAEWGQSQKMIVHRGSQIFGALRALKRGDLAGMQDALGMLEKKKGLRRNGGRRAARDASGLWLEHSFGWAPLINDIYTAVKVMASNPPAHKVVGRGSSVAEGTEGSTQPYNWFVQYNYTARCLVQADVYISNPNLALANQLGIVNPATVAWELVPFSFVVDWFIPVGKFLDSFSDLLGYRIEYPFSTLTRLVKSQAVQQQGPTTPILLDHGEGFFLDRTLGIPPFRLAAPPFKGFSAARGASAIALVIQQFLSIKR